MCLLSFLKWGSIGYSLGIVQWDFTKRDHLGNPGRVSGSGPVSLHLVKWKTICSNKDKGGLGVKCLGTLNKALLANGLEGSQVRTTRCGRTSLALNMVWTRGLVHQKWQRCFRCGFVERNY